MNQRNMLLSIGGIWWRCKRCGETFSTACDCCEPMHACAPNAIPVDAWAVTR